VVARNLLRFLLKAKNGTKVSSFSFGFTILELRFWNYDLRFTIILIRRKKPIEPFSDQNNRKS